MNVMQSLDEIKAARERIGITQKELSDQSGVSLPMIQLIEAKKANPSLRVFAQVSAVLGISLQLKFHFSAQEALGSYFGLLTHSPKIIQKLTPTQLIHWSALARSEESSKNREIDERVTDAWNAIQFCIFEYYPSFYKKLKLPRPRVDGRLIKLKRLTLPGLIEVMNS